MFSAGMVLLLLLSDQGDWCTYSQEAMHAREHERKPVAVHESEIVCRRRDLCTQRGSGEEDREPQSSQRRAQSPALESDRLRHHGQFPSTSRG